MANTKTADSHSGNHSGNTDAIGYARLLLGWMLAIITVSLLVQTRAGYVIAYYVLVLAIILLFLGSYPRIAALLELVQAPGPSSGGPSSE